ncbi:MAG: peptidoglycan DD-metalloendopeptidase family protein [bacterium]|nr:peptidoglycan DD-metalloendopeptidase family protein [bacterium]
MRYNHEDSTSSVCIRNGLNFTSFLKKTVSVLLVLSICFISVHFSLSASSASVGDLKNNINYLTQKQSKLKQELEGVKGKKNEAEREQKLQKQLVENMQSQVDACNNQIAKLNDEIAEKEKLIQEKDAELADTKYVFKQRIRALYMSGGTVSTLSMLMNSEDFSNILASAELTSAVSAYDNTICEKIVESMSEINAAKSQIEKKKKEQVEAKATLSAKLKELNTQLAEINQNVSDIVQDYDSLRASIKDYDKQIAAVEAEIKRLNTPANVKYSGGNFAWPVPGFYYISSGFGYRSGTYSGFHSGTDIAGSGIYGTPIIAAADGVVDIARYSNSYGYYVKIYHGIAKDGNSYFTLYAHMCKMPSVSVGQKVKKGDVIGYVGSSGWSTGAHLHFGVYINNSAVNPMSLF